MFSFYPNGCCIKVYLQRGNYLKWVTFMAIIKMSSGESWSQGEAACMHVFMPMWPLQWIIYMDGNSKTLKCCT